MFTHLMGQFENKDVIPVNETLSKENEYHSDIKKVELNILFK